MRWLPCLLPCLLPALLLACAQPAAAPERPARLIEPDAEVRAELRATVAAAIGQRDVRLADDAFTATDLLVLEAAARAQRPELRLPPEAEPEAQHFRLLLQSDRCVLLHPASERRWVLERARCEAL